KDVCIALYLFMERAGNVVHNQVAGGLDLRIPTKYMILKQTVLDPVWRAFNWDWGFWKDGLINVAGLIPFGFFVCAWLTAKGFGRPVLGAVASGFAVSLLIELVQTHLPTRDSSMADVINNCAGTIIGAFSYTVWGRLIDRWLACREIAPRKE